MSSSHPFSPLPGCHGNLDWWKPLRYWIPPCVCITPSMGSSRKIGNNKQGTGFYKKHRIKLGRNLGSSLKNPCKKTNRGSEYIWKAQVCQLNDMGHVSKQEQANGKASGQAKQQIPQCQSIRECRTRQDVRKMQYQPRIWKWAGAHCGEQNSCHASAKSQGPFRGPIFRYTIAPREWEGMRRRSEAALWMGQAS